MQPIPPPKTRETTAVGTRSLANELNDIARDELVGLTPTDRLHLVLKATAASDDDALNQLTNTIPTYSYKAGDLDYRRLVTNSMLVSLQAERDLLRSWLEFQWQDTMLTKHLLADMLARTFVNGELAIDEPADLRERETPEDVAEGLDRLEETLIDTAADLYIDYHAYQAFAREHLGISLETLLAHDSQHTHIVEFVKETLDRCEEEGMLARANEWLADIAADVEAEAKADPDLDTDSSDITLDFTLDDLADCDIELVLDTLADRLSRSRRPSDR